MRTLHTFYISLDRRKEAVLADQQICVSISDLFFCRRKRSLISIICPGTALWGGIIGNPVKIGSGPATVSSDDPLYGPGTRLTLVAMSSSGFPATVIMMGRHGRKEDLQVRRPARVRPALSSKAKKAEVSVSMRIINAFNPRPSFYGRGFFWFCGGPAAEKPPVRPHAGFVNTGLRAGEKT
jgi:hypothetical protein